MKKYIIAAICVIVASTITGVLLFLNSTKAPPVTITSLHIESTTVRLESDMSKKLSVSVHPNKADKAGYKLVSEDAFVAVCEDGAVTAVNEGETYVYAKSLDGKVKSNKVKVIVNNNIFEAAAKVILLAKDQQYLSKTIPEEIEQIKEDVLTEEPKDIELIENTELTPKDASQITGTEIEEVPETFQLPVATEENGGDMVYVTKSGSKFHLNTCVHAKGATAVLRSQAVSDGKTPCKKCNP